MSEWKPIETAPKDGTLICVWSARIGWPLIVRRNETHNCWTMILPRTGYINDPELDPTHWHSLPDPPMEGA